MADSIRKSSSTLLLALFIAHASQGAAVPSLGGAFTFSADEQEADLRSGAVELSGNVRVTQGAKSIESQTAKGRDMRSDTNRWTFEKSVRIRSEEADLQSNLATAAVVNGQIADVRIEGTPARFEQVGGTPARQVRGRAGVIEYDVDAGVVKLTNQVWFSNGKDEFRGDVVIYNLRDERVQINPGGSSNRVRGIIRPTPDKNDVKPPNGGGAAAIVEPQFQDGFEAQADEWVVTEEGGGA